MQLPLQLSTKSANLHFIVRSLDVVKKKSQNVGIASPHGGGDGEGGGDGGDGGGDGGEGGGDGGDGGGDGGGGGGGRPGQKLQVPLHFSTNKGFLHLFDLFFSVKPRQNTGSASPHGSGVGEGGGDGDGDRVQSEQLSWQLS